MTGKTGIRKLNCLAHDDGASVIVEFAVSAFVLLSLLFGTIWFALAAYSYHFVTWAAQQGTRYAIVRGADWTSSCSTSAPPNFTMNYACQASSSDIQNSVKSLATGVGVNAGLLTVNATWPQTTPACSSSCSACATNNSSGCYVNVTVTYSFNSVPLPFLPKSALSMTATSQKVIQK
jgi:Flp pilus assembly protein TadG